MEIHKMKVGDKVLWKPIDLVVEWPTRKDCVVKILEIDNSPPQPLVMVEWYNGTKSWVLLKNLTDLALIPEDSLI